MGFALPVNPTVISNPINMMLGTYKKEVENSITGTKYTSWFIIALAVVGIVLIVKKVA